MRVVKTICQWLSSGLVAVLVPCIAFAVASVAYGWLDLRAKLGLDDDVCLLALVIGPLLIVAIHRRFHRSPKMPIAALAGGLLLGGAGAWQFLRAREASAQHVPSGPFSGIEHTFAMALGLFAISIAVLAILSGTLALLARRIPGDA